MSEALPLIQILLIIPLVMIIAGVYASVGLGGGTGYLAILSLAGMSVASMVPTVLLLNLVVTGAALIRFGPSGNLQWRLLLPFLLPAIPAAFIGGYIKADPKIFYYLLTLVLTCIAVVTFMNVSASKKQTIYFRHHLLLLATPIGLILGFISGFLGVGGGILLGPILIYTGFANHKQMASINSAFVLSLSITGLLAHGIRAAIGLNVILPLAVAVLIGGLIGATFSEKKFSPLLVQRILAVIILIAAIKAAIDAIA
jgi:uncharacterized membrane protein YfcA